MPNKLSQFWEELKRRKVTRVITVYAAAAFVILELVDIIVDPLKLPEWFLTTVIVFLCIGFIIAVILSWTYDVHPEEGIVKTEPAEKAKAEDIPKSSNNWKIASYISFMVIIVLIVLNIVPRNNNKVIMEKSIAVLPLEYLSDDSTKEYLANAVLDAITGHLSKIEGLRVMPRTSVEQYRENKKTAKEIGEELDVSYLIEGSFLMIEDQVKLTIQLVVAAEGDHVFFKEYDRSYEDIFVVQSEVAQTIANEIEVAITPEEKQLIEKIPTDNLIAYGLYQRGREEYLNYRSGNYNRESLDRAEELYHEALKSDSEFALAYTGLARIYWEKHYWESYFSEDFLDSVLILADKALFYDDKLSAAYTVKGDYYSEIGLTEMAIDEYDKATKLNPNNWEAYLSKGWLYYSFDLVKSIENLHKAAFINRGTDLSRLYRFICMVYRSAGFMEEAEYYNHAALKLDGDSTWYLFQLSAIVQTSGNYDDAIDFLERVYETDSINTSILIALGKCYMFLGQFEESLEYIVKYVERLEELGNVDLNDMVEIGYIYWKNGYREEAEYYFKEQINYCNRVIELGRQYSDYFLTYYDLAAVYAFKGEKDKAYENLRVFNQRQVEHSWMVIVIKDDPLFDSIRDEPEFQQIVRDVEAKYQAEHERVRQWLEENDDML